MDRRAGFAIRAAALLIDLAAMATAVGLVIAITTLDRARASGAAAPADAALVGLAVAAVELLFVCVEAFTGVSLGKLLLGLRVRAPDQGAASFERRLARAFLKYPLSVLGFFGALFTAPVLAAAGALQITALAACLGTLRCNGLALHDRLAGTAVFPSWQLRLSRPARAAEVSPAQALEEIRRSFDRGDHEEAVVHRLAALGVPPAWVRAKLLHFRIRATAAGVPLTRSGRPLRTSFTRG